MVKASFRTHESAQLPPAVLLFGGESRTRWRMSTIPPTATSIAAAAAKPSPVRRILVFDIATSICLFDQDRGWKPESKPHLISQLIKIFLQFSNELDDGVLTNVILEDVPVPPNGAIPSGSYLSASSSASSSVSSFTSASTPSSLAGDHSGERAHVSIVSSRNDCLCTAVIYQGEELTDRMRSTVRQLMDAFWEMFGKTVISMKEVLREASDNVESVAASQIREKFFSFAATDLIKSLS